MKRVRFFKKYLVPGVVPGNRPGAVPGDGPGNRVGTKLPVSAEAGRP